VPPIRIEWTATELPATCTVYVPLAVTQTSSLEFGTPAGDQSPGVANDDMPVVGPTHDFVQLRVAARARAIGIATNASVATRTEVDAAEATRRSAPTRLMPTP
jgi:hypothetical protein